MVDMTAGDRRPPGTAVPPPPQRGHGSWEHLRPRSLPVALAEAVLVALLAALVWALLKGILDYGLGLIVIAALGGWAIGALLWQVRASPLWAALVAGLAWLLGLVLTWVVAMAILPDSARTFVERLQGTPFIDWLSPQFGILELAGLAIYVVAGLYGARPRTPPAARPPGSSSG